VTYHCPECGDVFSTLEGAAMHAINKQDDAHSRFTSKYQAKRTIDDYNDEQDEQTDPETDPEPEPEPEPEPTDAVDSDRQPLSDGSGEYDLPNFPEQDDAEPQPEIEQPEVDIPDCCSDPELAGSAGEAFLLESGEAVKLEQGEQICLNCDTIHD